MSERDEAAMPEPASEEPRQPERQEKKRPFWQEAILILVSALVLALVLKTLVVQSFFIPSASMEPTLVGSPDGPKDRILVQKVSYWAGDIQRGDIVVFADPGGWLPAAETGQPRNIIQRGLESVGLYPAGGHVIKRVIGLGGDRVQCCDGGGRVRVNGVPLDEPYLADPTSGRQKTFDVTVPDGRLWLMGDNRGNSQDSRFHQDDLGGGSVDADLVVGKGWAILWPWDRAGKIAATGGD